MTNAGLAQWQLAIYGCAPDPGWDCHTPLGDPVVWTVKVLDGVTHIILRGSVTPGDWLRDFLVLPEWTLIEHVGLGFVHTGFFLGMEAVRDEILERFKAPYVIAGHSLGAARGAVLTGLLELVRPGSVTKRVAWGEPRSGMTTLANLIKRVPTVSYHNMGKVIGDPVAEVPFWSPEFPYVHAVDLTSVCVKPVGRDWLNPAKWHSMALYALAMNSIKE